MDSNHSDEKSLSYKVTHVPNINSVAVIAICIVHSVNTFQHCNYMYSAVTCAQSLLAMV